MTWLAPAPWVCEDFTCHDWIDEMQWWCDGWICEVPSGIAVRNWWRRLGRKATAGGRRW